MIEFIKSNLRGNVDLLDEREFSRNIKDLKQFRLESDYEDMLIDREKGEKALHLASDLRKFLQQKLHTS